MKKLKLLKTIYVHKEEDGESSWCIASENVDEANDGEVGIYELIKTVKKSTETVLK